MAVQPHSGPDGAIQRDDRSPGGAAGAGLRQSRPDGPAPGTQPPRFDSRGSPREPGRAGERPGGADGTAVRRARHPDRTDDHLPQEGPGPSGRRVPLCDPGRHRERRLRGGRHDQGLGRGGRRAGGGTLASRAREARVSLLDTPLSRSLGIEVPLVCGAMYPCSNPELVAAVSEAGGIGIVQPISLTYVHGHDFREGLRLIRRLTSKPIGMNALIEQSSKTYHERMSRWIDIALEEGVRFFVTSLGNPRWVVDRVSAAGGVVYHDVTERKWGEKGRDVGVD